LRRGGTDGERALRGVLKWQWELIMQPILDRLGLRECLEDERSNWPRLWLILCRGFTSFPLYACGDYDEVYT